MATFKRSDRYTSRLTPNVELSAGIRPAHHNVAAPYLPLKRYDTKLEAWKVISTGKVVAFDSTNFTVPAGLAIDIETAITGGYADRAAFVAATALFAEVYTQYDVDNGIKNFAGATVQLNEPVVASFFASYNAAGTLNNPVGFPVGIAMFDFWEQNGAGFAGNPADYKYANFNLQQGGTIVTRYFMEYPVVANTSGVVFPNLSVFVGNPKPGDLVTFGADSNLKVLSALTASNVTGNTEAVIEGEANRIITGVHKSMGRILGRVWGIDQDFPKDYLEMVKTWAPNITGLNALDKAPGTATAGLPDNLTFAGVTDPAAAKIAYVNIVVA